MTLITYKESFKYIGAIFLVLGSKTNIARTDEVATTPSTPNYDSLPYSLPQGRVVKTFALKWPKWMIPQLAAVI